MKTLLLLFVVTFAYNCSYTQIVEKINLQFQGAQYDVITIKIDSSVSSRFQLVDNFLLLSERKLVDSLSKKGIFLMSSAGVVDSACNFLGLSISSGNKSQAINLADGAGNFFLKPNGFIGINGNGIVVKKTEYYLPSANYVTAVQSGPMLIADDTINSKFDKNSKNRNFRVGVGIYTVKADSYIVFATALVPVTFYQFASLFAEKFKCNNALNLESGTNCSLRLPSSKRIADSTRVLCKFLYLPLK